MRCSTRSAFHCSAALASAYAPKPAANVTASLKALLNIVTLWHPRQNTLGLRCAVRVLSWMVGWASIQRMTYALSASALSHAEMPRFLAFRLYDAFSCAVQRNSTRSVAGFLMGGLPLLGAFMAAIMPVQKSFDKMETLLYSVRTLNKEIEMKTKQEWQVGAEVKVGFVAGLHIHEKVASPNNYRPDGYILSKGNSIYAFVPHNGGLNKCASFDAAREVIQS